MRKVTLFILFFQLQLFCLGQDMIVGAYRDHFGEKLEFLNDSIFKHTWNFDLASSWTKGKYSLSNDTIFLKSILIKDTLTIRNSANKIIKDSLVVSRDDESSRIENIEFLMSEISGGGQYRKLPPEKLYLKKNKLFRLRDNGKIDKSKFKDWWSNKKFKTYFISENK